MKNVPRLLFSGRGGVRNFYMATTKKNAWSKLPTSNADSGCIFSMLKKNQRDMRSELKNDNKCASISRNVNLVMLYRNQLIKL